MTAASLSGLFTALITLSLVVGCGSAKQIGYQTRPEQPEKSDTRFEVTMFEPVWGLWDATTIYAHFRAQELRPSRNYWLEIRYNGTDSIAMKADYVVVSSPNDADTISVGVWERATTGYGIYDPVTDRTSQASLLLASITVYGREPVDTLNYSFDLLVVHFDTVASLEGPIHFEGRAIKYRY
jgi:hypothetical protein